MLGPRAITMRARYALISSLNFIVFTLLDFLDFLFCFFYLFLDRFLEENPVPCYCYSECEDEDELSETLCGRSNLFRNMVAFCRRRRRRRRRRNDVLRPSSRRWSDCGCSECVSWQEKEEQKLHFVVKKAFQDKIEDSQKDSIENVIFIHGFLSSSFVWAETVFPNIPENASLNLMAADLLGFGKSPKPMDCLYRLKDHLDMIEKSLIEPFHLQSFHLVAHSMGCVIALALAAKYPKHIKSITLVGVPYPSSESTREKASLTAMNTMCEKKIWPPLAFSSAIMTWYEHLGRTTCLIFCRNHAFWEWLMKLFTRDIHFMLRDMTRHTHHSAWHTMHNVICGEAKFLDNYLETVKREGIPVKIIQGDKDQVTPLEYGFKLKEKLPHSELQIIPNADHQTVFLGREKEFTTELQQFWFSAIECESASKVA